MKQNTILLSAVALAGVLQAFTANHASTSIGNETALTGTRMTTEGTGALAPATTDTAFANEAAMGGLAEVELGKMAAEKGMDPKVKEFGHMMTTDHGKANEELKAIAASKKIELTTRLDAEHMKLSERLSKLSGKDFDAAYVKAMVEGHKKTLALMQAEAANGKDAELKAFAAKTAPVVKMHLTRIEQIEAEMK